MNTPQVLTLFQNLRKQKAQILQSATEATRKIQDAELAVVDEELRLENVGVSPQTASKAETRTLERLQRELKAALQSRTTLETELDQVKAEMSNTVNTIRVERDRFIKAKQDEYLQTHFAPAAKQLAAAYNMGMALIRAGIPVEHAEGFSLPHPFAKEVFVQVGTLERIEGTNGWRKTFQPTPDAQQSYEETSTFLSSLEDIEREAKQIERERTEAQLKREEREREARQRALDANPYANGRSIVY